MAHIYNVYFMLIVQKTKRKVWSIFDKQKVY